MAYTLKRGEHIRVDIVSGKRAPFAHHDPRPCLMPPDWSGGYASIFSLQQKEEAAAARGAMM